MTEIRIIMMECCFLCEKPLQYCGCSEGSRLRDGKGLWDAFMVKSDHDRIVKKMHDKLQADHEKTLQSLRQQILKLSICFKKNNINTGTEKEYYHLAISDVMKLLDKAEEKED